MNDNDNLYLHYYDFFQRDTTDIKTWFIDNAAYEIDSYSVRPGESEQQAADRHRDKLNAMVRALRALDAKHHIETIAQIEDALYAMDEPVG